MSLENEGLAEILYQAYADPDSLTGSSLDRAQHWMLTNYHNFMRVHLAHSSLRDSLWDVVKDSAEQALAYRLNPQNTCVARYEAVRGK